VLQRIKAVGMAHQEIDFIGRTTPAGPRDGPDDRAVIRRKFHQADLSMHIVLWLRRPVERLGVESMVRGLACRVNTTDDLPTSIEATSERPGGVLVVALQDVDEHASLLLGPATAAGLKLLVLVDDLNVLHLLRGIRFSGLALKNSLDLATFRDAVDRIFDGEVPMPAEVAHHLMRSIGAEPGAGERGESAPIQIRLTPRERQVLVLLVDGLSNKQIGRRLGVSDHGAKRLVANILAKLNSTNRTAAVARALREGIYERCTT
jgi:DNA-binding NarL/FixJ family response regulator